MTYAGDIAPEDAFEALRADPSARLVDVRTEAEWAYVGVPDLAGIDQQLIRVEWQRFPDGTRNNDFVDQVRAAGAGEGPTYLLCRSGVRSAAAAEAMTAAGLGPAYNVLDGFEGGLDESGHRSVAGWKVAGLPWRQG
ncbi:rhodanese-like domain-containing protein [Luteipulveratus sp. YIM 133132]|uniref:rhodanese-like domain-containing protein n=1 Tax=Luteipulveratus flavus TaxID=3031728 RepID=UPI0023AFFAF1|nr:rhodanese-like domain-containing protein [Luteipulveratus sp. YIM 133132]MDE9367508.1 rhodanese-like domain-containing protein [Luteipulveratus sp. YIM 133132]